MSTVCQAYHIEAKRDASCYCQSQTGYFKYFYQESCEPVKHVSDIAKCALLRYGPRGGMGKAHATQALAERIGVS